MFAQETAAAGFCWRPLLAVIQNFIYTDREMSRKAALKNKTKNPAADTRRHKSLKGKERVIK